MRTPDPDFERLRKTLCGGQADRVPLGEVLIDEGAKVSKGLGLFTTEWSGAKIEQNVPTVFLIDKKGIVRFKYISQNTFDRPQAEYLLKFLETMGK